MSDPKTSTARAEGGIPPGRRRIELSDGVAIQRQLRRFVAKRRLATGPIGTELARTPTRFLLQLPVAVLAVGRPHRLHLL